MTERAPAPAEQSPLQALAANLLRDQRLILVSNRGPMEYHSAPGGALQARRGSGGVVTALSGLTNHVDFTWIASAMSDGDRRRRRRQRGTGRPLASAGAARLRPLRQHAAPRLPQALQRHLQPAPLVHPALYVEFPLHAPRGRRRLRRVGERLRRGQPAVRRRRRRGGEPLRRRAARDGPRLPVVPRSRDGAEAVAPRPHPPVHAYPLADRELLGTAARDDPLRDLRQPLQRGHRGVSGGARREVVSRQLRRLPRQRRGGLPRPLRRVQRTRHARPQLSHLHRRGRGAPDRGLAPRRRARRAHPPPARQADHRPGRPRRAQQEHHPGLRRLRNAARAPPPSF